MPSLTFWIKSNKNLQSLPCFILLSVLDSFSKIAKFRYVAILTKISSTDTQNSHKEEAMKNETMQNFLKSKS